MKKKIISILLCVLMCATAFAVAENTNDKDLTDNGIDTAELPTVGGGSGQDNPLASPPPEEPDRMAANTFYTYSNTTIWWNESFYIGWRTVYTLEDNVTVIVGSPDVVVTIDGWFYMYNSTITAEDVGTDNWTLNISVGGIIDIGVNYLGYGCTLEYGHLFSYDNHYHIRIFDATIQHCTDYAIYMVQSSITIDYCRIYDVVGSDGGTGENGADAYGILVSEGGLTAVATDIDYVVGGKGGNGANGASGWSATSGADGGSGGNAMGIYTIDSSTVYLDKILMLNLIGGRGGRGGGGGNSGHPAGNGGDGGGGGIALGLVSENSDVTAISVTGKEFYGGASGRGGDGGNGGDTNGDDGGNGGHGGNGGYGGHVAGFAIMDYSEATLEDCDLFDSAAGNGKQGGHGGDGGDALNPSSTPLNGGNGGRGGYGSEGGWIVGLYNDRSTVTIDYDFYVENVTSGNGGRGGNGGDGGAPKLGGKSAGGNAGHGGNAGWLIGVFSHVGTTAGLEDEPWTLFMTYLYPGRGGNGGNGGWSYRIGRTFAGPGGDGGDGGNGGWTIGLYYSSLCDIGSVDVETPYTWPSNGGPGGNGGRPGRGEPNGDSGTDGDVGESHQEKEYIIITPPPGPPIDF